MTREEREDAINCFKNKLENEVYGAKYNKLALEALEQEPCDGCISRQSVLDKIQRLIDAEQNNIDENGDYMNYARERVNAYEAIQFFVENDCLCPSVTPQTRKGHWIEQIDHEENCRTLICSNCDRPALHDGDSIWKHKFCPHCGADMREVEDGNDNITSQTKAT